MVRRIAATIALDGIISFSVPLSCVLKFPYSKLKDRIKPSMIFLQRCTFNFRTTARPVMIRIRSVRALNAIQ